MQLWLLVQVDFGGFFVDFRKGILTISGKGLLTLSLFCAIAICSLASATYAQTPSQIFERNQARTMVHKDVTEIQPSEFQFFRRLPPLLELEENAEAEGTLDKPKSSRVPATREEILALRGDPSKNKPVLAIDDAPEPFIALQEALNIGDYELAFQYARQYSRYMDDLKSNNEKVMGFLATAKRREGLSVEGDWTSSDDYRELAYLMEDDDLNKGSSYIASVNSSAFGHMTSGDFDNTSREEQLESQRTRVRNTLLRRQLPRGVKGPINAYLFFNINDLASQRVARELEMLHQANQSFGINIVGMSIEQVGQAELQTFQRRAGITFPVNNGSILAESMDMTVAPTAVFMPQDGGQAVFEEGVRDHVYYEELLKIMRTGT